MSEIVSEPRVNLQENSHKVCSQVLQCLRMNEKTKMIIDTFILIKYSFDSKTWCFRKSEISYFWSALLLNYMEEKFTFTLNFVQRDNVQFILRKGNCSICFSFSMLKSIVKSLQRRFFSNNSSGWSLKVKTIFLWDSMKNIWNKFKGSYWWLFDVRLCEYAEMDYIIFLLEFRYWKMFIFSTFLEDIMV